jgi:hypothetical protein
MDFDVLEDFCLGLSSYAQAIRRYPRESAGASLSEALAWLYIHFSSVHTINIDTVDDVCFPVSYSSDASSIGSLKSYLYSFDYRERLPDP